MKLSVPALAACTILLMGCRGPGTITEDDRYPVEVRRGPTLNIQVIREETEVEMTNTSGRSFGPCRMWLNGRFSYDLKGFAVGELCTLRLADFKDQYGEQFKGGGFFATERLEKLALAELQVDGQMFGLIVVGGQDPY